MLQAQTDLSYKSLREDFAYPPPQAKLLQPEQDHHESSTN